MSSNGDHLDRNFHQRRNAPIPLCSLCPEHSGILTHIAAIKWVARIALIVFTMVLMAVIGYIIKTQSMLSDKVDTLVTSNVRQEALFEALAKELREHRAANPNNTHPPAPPNSKKPLDNKFTPR